MNQVLLSHLQFLYGDARAQEIYPRLEEIVSRRQEPLSRHGTEESAYLNEQDAVLITYGDMVQTPGERPLQTLNEFLSETISDSLNTIHILPFFPYSSDDGFSIIDYKQVDPALGEWSDLRAINDSFQLMFDAVVNHVSSESSWFQGFLECENPYNEYFIVVPEDANLAQVFRPRALPLVSEVQTAEGLKLVWTTFSSDQIDLNFANPDVLLAVIDTLLFYVEHGAALIRLDAIAYIWKELDSTCIHLPQTHRIIQLMRSVLDVVAPQVILITETNVPHEDNVSYFGDGYNEAQMVYNFSLPPLTLHAFHQGNAEILSEWAAALTLPSPRVSFFNFLASHDGIGLTPARGLLADEEVQAIADRVEALGGYVSYRSNSDGSESPYELNISYIDALGEPSVEEGDELVARRFLATQAIMLSLRGVPGIYFHSLYGSRSWKEGAERSGQKRRINRQKLQRCELEAALADPSSLRSMVFFSYGEMLRKRAAEPAFHPTGEQEVVQLHPALFALWRRSLSGDSELLCLHNVAKETIHAGIDLKRFQNPEIELIDLLSGREFTASDGRLDMDIVPYGVYWLRPYNEHNA